MSSVFGWKDHKTTFFNAKVLHTAGAQFTKVSRSRDALKMLHKPVDTNKLSLEYDSSMNAHIYDSEYQADRQKQIQHDYKYYVPGQQTLYFHRQTTDYKRMNTDTHSRPLQNLQQQEQDDPTVGCLQSVKLLSSMTKSLQLHEGSQKSTGQINEECRKPSQSLSSLSSLNLSSKLSQLQLQVSTSNKAKVFQGNGSHTERIQRTHNSQSEDWNNNSNSQGSFKENSMNKMKTMQGLGDEEHNKLPQLGCVYQFHLVGSKSKELSSVPISPAGLSQLSSIKKEGNCDGDTDQGNTVSSARTKATTSSTKNSMSSQKKPASFGQQDHLQSHRKRQYSQQQLMHSSNITNLSHLQQLDLSSSMTQVSSVGSLLSSTKMENKNDDFMRLNNQQKKAYCSSEAFSSKQNDIQRYIKQTAYQSQWQLAQTMNNAQNKMDERMDKKDEEIVEIQELNIQDAIREDVEKKKEKTGEEIDGGRGYVKKVIFLPQPLRAVSTASPLESPQLLDYINILDEQLGSNQQQQQQQIQQFLQSSSEPESTASLSSLTKLSIPSAAPGGVIITEGQLFSVEEETSSACKNSIGTQQNEDICYDSEGEEMYPRRMNPIQKERKNDYDQDEDEQDHSILKCMQIHQGDDKDNIRMIGSNKQQHQSGLLGNSKKDKQTQRIGQWKEQYQQQQQYPSSIRVDKTSNNSNMESQLKKASRNKALMDAGGIQSHSNSHDISQKEGSQQELMAQQRFSQQQFEVSPTQGCVRRLEWRPNYNSNNNNNNSSEKSIVFSTQNNNNNILNIVEKISKSLATLSSQRADSKCDTINTGKQQQSRQEQQKTQSSLQGLVLPSILDGKSLHLVPQILLSSSAQQYSARHKSNKRYTISEQ